MYVITNPTAATFARLVQLVQSGQGLPLFDESFPLQDLRSAQEGLLKRSHVGKYVAVL